MLLLMGIYQIWTECIYTIIILNIFIIFTISYDFGFFLICYFCVCIHVCIRAHVCHRINFILWNDSNDTLFIISLAFDLTSSYKQILLIFVTFLNLNMKSVMIFETTLLYLSQTKSKIILVSFNELSLLCSNSSIKISEVIIWSILLNISNWIQSILICLMHKRA